MKKWKTFLVRKINNLRKRKRKMKTRLNQKPSQKLRDRGKENQTMIMKGRSNKELALVKQMLASIPSTSSNSSLRMLRVKLGRGSNFKALRKLIVKTRCATFASNMLSIQVKVKVKMMKVKRMKIKNLNVRPLSFNLFSVLCSCLLL